MRHMRIWVWLALVAGVGYGTAVSAQEIQFDSDLPRTLVFIPEEGRSGVGLETSAPSSWRRVSR